LLKLKATNPSPNDMNLVLSKLCLHYCIHKNLFFVMLENSSTEVTDK
jgi:hypothetical protein